MAIRYSQWKVSFLEQHGKVSDRYPAGVWQSQFTRLRAPNLYNLLADPFERAPESQLYAQWSMQRVFLFVPAQALVARWLESFKEFPIRQKPASFNLDEVMEKLTPKQ
jgi:arylsulfatase